MSTLIGTSSRALEGRDFLLTPHLARGGLEPADAVLGRPVTSPSRTGAVPFSVAQIAPSRSASGAERRPRVEWSRAPDNRRSPADEAPDNTGSQDGKIGVRPNWPLVGGVSAHVR